MYDLDCFCCEALSARQQGLESIPIDARRMLKNAHFECTDYSQTKKYRQETLMSKVESERSVTIRRRIQGVNAALEARIGARLAA
ncbi:hypothetical protein E6B08_06270 [Pseudomonas putida]|uniref:Uncharacterized protein n=1 Tax=Pseudomonas putida TaxID=303 RepID=A0A4D6XAE8_PSEPU|nr:hypothetical protein [Pseudomonas putida]QCI11040.1 hypothetical protein E6B08_06270 [Pseudomonas putida]